MNTLLKKAKTGIEVLKVTVQVIALELDLPAVAKDPMKPRFATIVMKRGKKERIENIKQKLPFVPLSQVDEEVLIENVVTYTKVIERLG